MMLLVGFVGYNAYEREGLTYRLGDLSNETILIKRRGIDVKLSSLAWNLGKEDWLFLGDNYQKIVSKLTLSMTPKQKDIDETKEIFTSITQVATQNNIKVALLIAPNKSTIYPEYLPDQIVPSEKKYIDFFLVELNKIPNLIIYNPTKDMLDKKILRAIYITKQTPIGIIRELLLPIPVSLNV
jgi:hypothetical protein